MEGIEKVYQFLDEAHTYYLATVEGDQPRVRAFGTALLYDGKLYIQTGKVKPVSKQIAANPKVEICAFKDGKWLRIAGELVNDDDKAVKEAMLEKNALAESNVQCRRRQYADALFQERRRNILFVHRSSRNDQFLI